MVVSFEAEAVGLRCSWANVMIWCAWRRRWLGSSRRGVRYVVVYMGEDKVLVCVCVAARYCVVSQPVGVMRLARGMPDWAAAQYGRLQHACDHGPFDNRPASQPEAENEMAGLVVGFLLAPAVRLWWRW